MGATSSPTASRLLHTPARALKPPPSLLAPSLHPPSSTSFFLPHTQPTQLITLDAHGACAPGATTKGGHASSPSSTGGATADGAAAAASSYAGTAGTGPAGGSPGAAGAPLAAYAGRPHYRYRFPATGVEFAVPAWPGACHSGRGV